MKTDIGLIVGNRGFFPDKLAEEGRREAAEALQSAGLNVISPGEGDTPFGTVESWEDAKKCAALFKGHADSIKGIVVSLPNFGQEKGVADAIRLSGLQVPVLVQAEPDAVGKMTMGNRKDAFCGKISVCNNLRQYGIPFTTTTKHTVSVDSEEFQSDLKQFIGVCRVVDGLKDARVGAIGARPADFNTVRFSEKIFEKHGISVETLDLSEIIAAANDLDEEAAVVREKIETIKSHCQDVSVASDDSLAKMAKFGVVLERVVEQLELDACAIQCWTSLEANYGIVPCTIMSMLSQDMLPAACEVDVGGALAMYALQLAADSPSAILDWNNNYGGESDKCVLFHCSNIPADLLQGARMGIQDIIAGDVGEENAVGTCTGRIKSGPMTFARIGTDDENGIIKAYVGEGRFVDDDLDTFGGYGVASIDGLQRLLQYVCHNGFEHHVAVNLSQCGQALSEAFETYLNFTTYHHNGQQ